MLKSFKRDLSHPVHAHDHILGNSDANVRIVIYADFADPETISLHRTVQEILNSFGDDVLVAYRHFPDTVAHPQAYAVARAIEAASKQDKFAEMLEQILTNQNKLDDGLLLQYARVIDLDKAQFRADFSADDVSKHIKHDIQTAKESKVDKVPAIFVKGVRQSTLSMRFIVEMINSGGEVSG